MTYTIEFPDEVWDQVHALPAEAATPFAEAMTLLTHEPWHGEPYHRANPDGALRQLIYGFGHGLVIYIILEQQQRVIIERVLWLEDLG
ncbi:type II toxin-antitoxin system RelE family toxin [Saccharothrix variisporea]|uniref:mRNA-degrading endonuclease RelE of RelBE toxin-antitoxin system n=1 Tax=Saccharothrix variisporea TaxID=543527 RepID=A0A495XL74_9PSEU|nr:hypothetical protein [Saccharothrix variisporea]RKT74399.1 hypothetical protein DFJ66_7751 [Saccharothrix variisporea]